MRNTKNLREQSLQKKGGGGQKHVPCEYRGFFFFFFSKRLYIKSCMLDHTDRAYLNSRQQCPLTSGWTMLNSLRLIRWLTLQRRQGRSLICNWADGGQTHRISSAHWVLQFASVCVCVRACVCVIAQCCLRLEDHANHWPVSVIKSCTGPPDKSHTQQSHHKTLWRAIRTDYYVKKCNHN